MSTESLEHHARVVPRRGRRARAQASDRRGRTSRWRRSSPALTALEVSTYFLDFGPLFLPVLLTLMTIKFLTVVAYFMHLKFDAPILRKAFYTGVILALCVYLVALSTFHFWGRP